MATDVLPEYIRLELSPTAPLPGDLQDKVIYIRVQYIHGSSSAAAAAGGLAASSQNPARQPAASAKQSESKAGRSSFNFNFSKAINGVKSEEGSAVSSRGDGKYEDGKDLHVSDAPGGRAKVVHLTPDALAPGNAERTLQQLDALQAAAGAARGGAGASAAASQQQPRPRAPAPGSHNASALASAAALLYDIGDDAAGDSPDSSATTAASAASAHPHPGSQPASKAPPPAAPPAAAPPGGTPLQQAAAAPVGAVRVLPPPPGLQVPQYTLRELPPPLPSPQAGSPTPHAGSCSQQDKQQQLEVVVMLPGVGGPGEVDVWLAPEGPGLGPAGGGGGGGSLLRVTVAGRYHLELVLPCHVLDDTSRAKWSRAKQRLTLLLQRAP